MGLKYWSVAFTASIANQYVIKMARIITHKPKVLMFNFAYHGTVDETIKQMPNPGEITLRCSMDVFPGQDLSATTSIVDFNKLEALEAELATGDIAIVMAEPMFTNCGWWQPEDGFWDEVYDLCRRYGAYLCFDETHTISVGHEGFAGKWKMKCDFWTCGKSISGGLPCAVYGFGEEVGHKFSHELHNCTGLAGACGYGGYHEYLLFYGLNRGIMKMPYFPMFMTSPQTTDADADALVQNFREAFVNMLG